MVSATDVLTEIVHESTQQGDHGFDITVAQIFDVIEPGRVDFGGDELDEAELRACPSNKRFPEDEYEWWNLESGCYVIEYNESVSTRDVSLTIQTRGEVLARGAFHPTIHVSSVPRVPFYVGGAGIRIKENARLSTIVDIDRDGA